MSQSQKTTGGAISSPTISPSQNITFENKSVDNTVSRQHQESYSIADELTKLADLKNSGILSEEEFVLLKQNIIREQ